MNKLTQNFKKLFTQENIVALATILLILHPILDLDYLLYGILDPLGLPLPSTGLHFLAMPLFILLVFAFIEPKKKKVFLWASGYGLLVMAYFVVHHLFTKDMFELLYLTNRYEYSVTTELRYVLTLIIPFGLIYAFYRSQFTQTLFNKIIVILSILISVPLVLSNIFVFGPSTYVGQTMANFFYWFNGIYEIFHPRQLATSFYFSEGNTTGILLFAIYPILINIYFQAKHKWLLLLLIATQGLAMYVLATRVATFGAPLMMGVMLFLYVGLSLIRQHKFEWKPFLLLSLVFMILLAMFPFTPAVVNQTIDSENDGLVLNEDYQRLEGKEAIKGQNLIPGTAEFNYFYQFMFEEYYFLLTIPAIYYEWYYPYEIDPKFYVDLIFEYELYQRASGRQFEQIFFDYKWDKLTDTQKLFGFGYSRFMMGSIVLEQDFKQQMYTLGYLGTLLLTFPWLLTLAYIVISMLRNIKKHLNLETLSIGMAITATYGAAYMSGHVLDQFFTTSFMALFVAVLLGKIWGRKEVHSE